MNFISADFLLSAIIDSSDDAIISKDLQGVVTSWNRAAERIFGFTAAEMIGQPITQIIPAERLNEEPKILETIRKGERVDHFETRRVRKDGTEIDISVTISPIRDAEGTIVGASKIARDVTAHKQAAAILASQKAKLETLNKVGRALTGELDLEKLVQAVTDAGTELCGAAFGAFFYNVNDDKGGSYMLFALSGAPRSAFEKFGMPRNTPIFGPTFAGEGVIRLEDVHADPRYGQMSPHFGMPPGHLPVRSYLAVPVISKMGGVIGGLFFGHPETGRFGEDSEVLMVAVAAQAAIAIDNARLYTALERDLTQQKQLEKALRESEAEAIRQSRIKDEFLATLSHELRTPLQSILGWTQILSAGESDADEIKLGLGIIDRNAHAQTRIIEDLLDMNRILAGKIRLDVQRVSLAPLIEAAIETVQPSANAKNIRLSSVLDPLARAVSGDPNRLQQIFWNLLSNAIKFTPSNGRVQVLLERVNSHLEVSVVDSGPGIAPEFLPHVFERFRQADGSSTRGQGGLGLGLAIVKHLTELHGGSVRAKSAPSQGATFTIMFPLAPLHDEAEAAQRRHPSAPNESSEGSALPRLDGLKVLVVDDEEDARNLIALMLKKAGAKTIAAGSAQQALELVRASPPDLIVSDIGMPVEDGYSLIRRIRALPVVQGGNVPAIALSAYTRTEDRIKAISAGFHMHLSKPADTVELLTMAVSLAKGRNGSSL